MSCSVGRLRKFESLPRVGRQFSSKFKLSILNHMLIYLKMCNYILLILIQCSVVAMMIDGRYILFIDSQGCFGTDIVCQRIDI
jgi:hypothetical protein